MDANPRDMATILQSTLFPRFAAIDGLPKAVAVTDVPTYGFFPAADVEYVGVALRYGYRPDAAAEVAIGNIGPGLPAVLRLPDAAAGPTEVVQVGLAAYPGYGRRTAAAEGTDVAKLQRGVQGGVNVLGGQAEPAEEQQ